MEINQPKKILYLVTQSEMGGAQTYIFDLAMYFNEKGWEVTVAAGEDQNGELFERLKRIGVAAYYLANLKRRVNFYNDIKVFFDLIKLIKKIKPDILHLNSSKAGAIGAIAGKIAGVKKIIYTAHGLALNEPLSWPKKIFYLLSERISAIYKHKIICVSEYDKQSILKYKIAKENKIAVIYNGIDLDNIKLLPKEEARQRITEISDNRYQISDILIGTIANFYPSKGLVYLIEAAREVKQLKDNIKFIVIGDGRQRKKLEKLIADYKLGDTVYLPGSIVNAKHYLKAFDLFVLPSVKEGLPYTLIEAQAAGLPTIATNVGGNPEIIQHNKNGLLILPANFNALAENIINLAQNKNKQAELARNGLEMVKKFDLKQMAARTETIYGS